MSLPSVEKIYVKYVHNKAVLINDETSSIRGHKRGTESDGVVVNPQAIEESERTNDGGRDVEELLRILRRVIQKNSSKTWDFIYSLNDGGDVVRASVYSERECFFLNAHFAESYLQSSMLTNKTKDACIANERKINGSNCTANDSDRLLLRREQQKIAPTSDVLVRTPRPMCVDKCSADAANDRFCAPSGQKGSASAIGISSFETRNSKENNQFMLEKEKIVPQIQKNILNMQINVSSSELKVCRQNCSLTDPLAIKILQSREPAIDNSDANESATTRKEQFHEVSKSNLNGENGTRKTNDRTDSSSVSRMTDKFRSERASTRSFKLVHETVKKNDSSSKPKNFSSEEMVVKETINQNESNLKTALIVLKKLQVEDIGSSSATPLRSISMDKNSDMTLESKSIDSEEEDAETTVQSGSPQRTTILQASKQKINLLLQDPRIVPTVKRNILKKIKIKASTKKFRSSEVDSHKNELQMEELKRKLSERMQYRETTMSPVAHSRGTGLKFRTVKKSAKSLSSNTMNRKKIDNSLEIPVNENECTNVNGLQGKQLISFGSTRSKCLKNNKVTESTSENKAVSFKLVNSKLSEKNTLQHFKIPKKTLVNEKKKKARNDSNENKANEKQDIESSTVQRTDECQIHSEITSDAVKLSRFTEDCVRQTDNGKSLWFEFPSKESQAPETSSEYVNDEKSGLDCKNLLESSNIRKGINQGPFHKIGVITSVSSKYESKFDSADHLEVLQTITEIHSCGFCERQFHDKHQMIVHERFHTGERPFKCTHCPETFISKSQRKKHRHFCIKMSNLKKVPFVDNKKKAKCSNVAVRKNFKKKQKKMKCHGLNSLGSSNQTWLSQSNNILLKKCSELRKKVCEILSQPDDSMTGDNQSLQYPVNASDGESCFKQQDDCFMETVATGRIDRATYVSGTDACNQATSGNAFYQWSSIPEPDFGKQHETKSCDSCENVARETVFESDPSAAIAIPDDRNYIDRHKGENNLQNADKLQSLTDRVLKIITDVCNKSNCVLNDELLNQIHETFTLQLHQQSISAITSNANIPSKDDENPTFTRTSESTVFPPEEKLELFTSSYHGSTGQKIPPIDPASLINANPSTKATTNYIIPTPASKYTIRKEEVSRPNVLAHKRRKTAHSISTKDNSFVIPKATSCHGKFECSQCGKEFCSYYKMLSHKC